MRLVSEAVLLLANHVTSWQVIGSWCCVWGGVVWRSLFSTWGCRGGCSGKAEMRSLQMAQPLPAQSSLVDIVARTGAIILALVWGVCGPAWCGTSLGTSRILCWWSMGWDIQVWMSLSAHGAESLSEEELCEGFASCAFQHRTLPHFLFAELLACVLNKYIRGAPGTRQCKETYRYFLQGKMLWRCWGGLFQQCQFPPKQLCEWACHYPRLSIYFWYCQSFAPGPLA